MTKTTSKIGNSHGIIFDATLMGLARLKAGDEVSITVHEGGSIVITPMRPVIEPVQAAEKTKQLILKNSELFRRLS